jgi:DNA polymerase elongation subunit (family B)
MATNRPKKLVVTKQFRLIDYHTYDESPQREDSDSGEEREFKPATDENQFIIQMFGINEKGETCCIYINDFQPFFFVKVGMSWTNAEKTAFHRDLQSKLDKRYKDSIVDVQLVECQKLYGFTAGKQDRFVKLTFKNTTTMNKVKNLWYTYNKNPELNGGEYRRRKDFFFLNTKLELYESNIPPLLRYFHIHNISPTGWVSFKTNRVASPPRKTTTCLYEYVCPVSELKPLPEKETIVPYKICSFDIEASSSHGDFPVPIKTYKRLVMNVVDTFIRQNSSQKMDLSIGKTLFQKVVLTAFGYDRFEDVDLVYPKKMPTKEKVKQLLEILLNEPIEKAKLANSEEDNSHLLTIDMIFEQMKDIQTEEGEGGGGDGDGEGGGEGPQQVTYSYGKKSMKKVKLDRATTIMDVLLSDSYERDDKIQIINDVMTRLFPRLEGDQVTFIGSTFMRYGDKEPYMNHCVVLNSCDPVEGAIIETADKETDVLMKWAQLIQRENPDIIIGYNIFGFDYEFMFRRAQETGCVNEFLKLSRKVNELCAKFDKTTNEHVIENTKLAVASGEYDLRYFKMTGRLQIDMYAYFRRDFNLSSYKLDDVACQFISDDILKIQRVDDDPRHGKVTELYSKNLMGLHVGDFIHIEMTGFTSDYFNDGQKFSVLDIKQVEVNETVKGKDTVVNYNVIVIHGHHDIDTKKSLKWGTAKDDVTPQDIFRLTKGSSADRSIVAKYCIQDCNLVQHLMNKIDVITGFVEMAKICSVPVSFLVFRGQGIKLTSFVAKQCREKNTLMPDIDKEGDADKYEGAIVLPPKCSIYMDNPVACVDYSSLYPSSMISQNLSHDSKVWTKEYDLEGHLIRVTGEQDKNGAFIYDNLPGYEYIDLEFDTYKYLRKTPTSKPEKTRSGTMICRWAQFPDGKKGIMPAILEELLKARKETRNMIKTEKDPFMQNILDKRQLGYKVTANSLYGQCGSKTSPFYEKDIAASTTATGRMMILYAKRIIEEVYGNMVYETKIGKALCKAEYIYGDTDSVFFTFNLENPETGEKIRGKPALEMTIEIAQDAAHLCTQHLKAPMELSYEKTLMPFILVRKKKYVGMLYETDANKGKMKIMGLSVKRRDTCDYFKDVYGGILKTLMDSNVENNIKTAIEFTEKSLNELIEGRVPMDKLTITKALRSDYKNPHTIAHKVLADRIGKRDPGNKPKPGDRIKFVAIVNETPKALMGDRIETPEFIKENKLKIDYNYYITNQLMKPLQQLFGLALEQIWEYQNKKSQLKTFRSDMDKIKKEVNGDLEEFIKKKEKICSAQVKKLLFDKVLTKILNEKNGIQAITAFYKGKR